MSLAVGGLRSIEFDASCFVLLFRENKRYTRMRERLVQLFREPVNHPHSLAHRDPTRLRSQPGPILGSRRP